MVVGDECEPDSFMHSYTLWWPLLYELVLSDLWIDCPQEKETWSREFTGSIASPLSPCVWSRLLNYTSVQPLPLFSLPSSLPNLIRESADAVCACFM